MSDPLIEHWKQRGRICLWRFPDQTRNYPGWEFWADAAGCLSLIDLLGLMLASPWTAKKTIELADASSVVMLPGNPATEKWRSPKAFTIHYPKDKVPDNHWKWEGSLVRPLLKLGRARVEELMAAMESVSKGVGDFCIHVDDQSLHGFEFEKMSIWFW